MRHWLIATIVSAITAATPCLAKEDPWSAMTKRDLDAIHDLVTGSHPGAIDPANRNFGRWLDSGHKSALQEADAASSLSAYQRILRRFINGFRDNHMRVRFESGTDQARWPGFSVRWDEKNRFVVALSEEPTAPIGAAVISCDNGSLEKRMERDVLPFMWNPELPHAKREFAANLLIADSFTGRPQRCLIARSETAPPTEIVLNWRPLLAADAARLRRASNGLETPARGVREINGVTLISLPSMDPDAGFSAFFAEVEAKIASLRKRPIVVLDVRGNRGGHTGIGHRLLSILFGAESVDRIVGSFDWTNEIRVSPGNAARYRATADTMQASGAFSKREVDAVRAAGDRIEAAAARGELFLPGGSRGQPPVGPAPPSPFSDRVFLLTDSACASACLDFADVARRLPGIVHIGLPTEADATYMESRHEILPSGLARLTFGIKATRNRIRANNEWYEPRHRWPGGKMTDEAIADWVKSLP